MSTTLRLIEARPALHARRWWLWERDPRLRHALWRPSDTLEQVAARLGSCDETSGGHMPRAHWMIERRPVSQGLGGESVARCVGALTVAMIPERVPCGSFEVLVGAPHQGRGYGRWAVSRVPEVLQRLWGVEVIKIGVFEDNVRALRLYESLGYGVLERAWAQTERGRRAVLWMSNRPDRLRRRRAGFF